jgi:hypothetical protein
MVGQESQIGHKGEVNRRSGMERRHPPWSRRERKYYVEEERRDKNPGRRVNRQRRK